MESRPDETPQVPVLRREVERPVAGGNGLLPVLVLAAAMTSTLAAAALAMSLSPRTYHCPRSGQRMMTTAPRATFARPVAPIDENAALRTKNAELHGQLKALREGTGALPAPAAIDPACAPRVKRGGGDVQEWTYEVCASAPDPSPILLRQR